MTASTHAECKKRRNADLREATKLRKQAGIQYCVGKLDPVVVAARFAEIPPDTRDNTQRICGDPVFERSALYRRVGQ